jgi:ribosomal protein S27AE
MNKNTETILELEETAAVGLSSDQCPRCRSEAFKLAVGAPVRESQRGFYNGNEYSVVTRQQLLCSECGQIFIQNSYE